MRIVDRLGIVGGGTMGGGIAHAFVAVGIPVVVVESDAVRADATRSEIVASVRRAGDRGRVPDVEAALELLTVTDDREMFVDADLVVEAVPELPELKRGVLVGVEQVIARDAVLASNTSSISIDALATDLVHPERFLGMHFFNPVPASQLVELVRAAGTAPSALDVARSAAERIGKETIEVSDTPGFASSRLGVAIGLEAIRMLEEGVASADDIDRAMVLGYRFPMGPLRLTDLVGLDVRLGIAEYLHSTLGDRFAPPRVLREKVERGELGKKSGRGFFDWSDGASAGAP
jgi:3-hydroxybutyryl-CoA dehydrogenase